MLSLDKIKFINKHSFISAKKLFFDKEFFDFFYKFSKRLKKNI